MAGFTWEDIKRELQSRLKKQAFQPEIEDGYIVLKFTIDNTSPVAIPPKKAGIST